MKRILVLLLAVGLVLGLSATAWGAAGDLRVNEPASTVISGTTVTINGSFPTDVNTGDTTDGLVETYSVESNIGTFSNNANASFSLSVTINDSNKTVSLTLYKITTRYEAGIKVLDQVKQKVDDWSKTFTIATPPTMQTSNISVSCNGSHGSFPVSIYSSDTFQFTLPGVCIYNKDTVTVSLSSGIDAKFMSNNSKTLTVNADSFSGGGYAIQVTSEGYNPSVYYLKINKNSGSIASIGSLSVSGATGSISSHSTNSSLPTTIEVSSSTTSANISASASAGSNADVKIYSGFSGGSQITSSLSVGSGNTDFRVEIISPDGSTKNTYYYRITRAANTNPTIVNDITLRTGAATNSTQIGAATGAISTTNATTTRYIQIPASYANSTIFYLHVSLPTGSSASTPITITIPSATTSLNQSVSVSANSTSYTIPINITREANANILKSVSFTYNGAIIGSLGTLSGASTQTLNLNTSATSATLKWELADGATLSSAKWGSTTLTQANAAGYSAGLPSSGSTALEFNIIASNGTTYKTTINVSRSGTVTNSLSSLYIKKSATTSTNGTYLFSTSPSSFSSGTADYKVYVDSDTDSIYVYPTPTTSGATVNLNNSTVSKVTDRYSNNGYFQVDLRSGSNTVKVNVTVNNTTSTYTLTIEREENVVQNASLDSLYVSKSSSSTSSGNRYTLDPSFSYSKTKYDVDLAKSVTEVYLHFTTYRTSSDVGVSVSGATKVSDGVYKATLSTNKTKTVTITVSYKNDETKYTVNLNNGNASSRAQLTRIRVASQASSSNSYQYNVLPDFDSTVKDYVALIPYKNSGSYAYVQATLDDTGNELRIDGDDVISGDWKEVSINRGNSVSVPIRVTDGDNNTTNYDLKIVAAKNNANDDADLDSLSVRTGSSTSSALTLSPSFSSGTTKYTLANVPNSTSTLRVYADPSDSSAWVIVNNVLMTGTYAEVDLDEGSNTITVLVYAEDCDTHKTYTVTVNRGASGNSDSTLSNLEVRYGSSDMQTLNLIPTFAKNTTNYTVNVDGSVTQIAFRPTTTDSSATISIMGKSEVSGQWTSYNALSSGTNSFLIIVTAGDGNTKSYYTVAVARGLSVVVSSQKMKVNGVDVTTAAYNINGNNYFKLRDIAYALRGTTKSFDVTYNNVTRVVSMTSGRNYTVIGGEMIRPVAAGKYQLSNQTVLLDGRSINLTAYNVDGNNYFMLREIGQLFNFGVTYDSSTGTVIIDSNTVYVPE